MLLKLKVLALTTSPRFLYSVRLLKRAISKATTRHLEIAQKALRLIKLSVNIDANITIANIKTDSENDNPSLRGVPPQ
jgi:hypothetical protein